MPAHLTTGPKWTPEEDEKLRKLWHKRISIDELAKRMGRTPCAVERRGLVLEYGPRILATTKTSLNAFALKTGYSRTRIENAAAVLGIVLKRLPRMTSKPMRDSTKHRIMLSALQQKKILKLLSSVPDGRKLFSGKAQTSNAGEWGTGKKPKQCRGHGGTDKPHIGRGYCTGCYERHVKYPRRKKAPPLWGIDGRPEACVSCGTVKRHHQGRGQCTRCFKKAWKESKELKAA